MTTTTWAILAAAVTVGGLWMVIVAREFTRLRRMHREAMDKVRQDEKARK